MNRIKIIKRSNLQLPIEQREQTAKELAARVGKLEAAQVVANWIDEWQASKPKNARRAFAELFSNSAPVLS